MIHSDGPYALPGKPNPDGLPVLDRLDVGDAFWGFSIYDNCGDWHLHGTFNGHDDPDGGACGHGILVYLGGAEPVQCGGLPADIVGTDGDDNIAGTSLGEVIHGLAGNDTIDGDGGPDTICGGPVPTTCSARAAPTKSRVIRARTFLRAETAKTVSLATAGATGWKAETTTIPWTEAGIRTGW